MCIGLLGNASHMPYTILGRHLHPRFPREITVGDNNHHHNETLVASNVGIHVPFWACHAYIWDEFFESFYEA